MLSDTVTTVPLSSQESHLVSYPLQWILLEVFHSFDQESFEFVVAQTWNALYCDDSLSQNITPVLPGLNSP